MSQENEKVLPAVGFSEATVRGLKNLFNFKGKIGRAEFWWCFLSWLISFPIVLTGSMCLVIIGYAVIVTMIPNLDAVMNPDNSTFYVCCVVDVAVAIFFLVVLLALMHRRFHDTGDNVAWANAFLCLAPFAIMGLFLTVMAVYLYETGNITGDNWSLVNREDIIYFTFCCLCLISLIAFIPVCVKTVRCLLKK